MPATISLFSGRVTSVIHMAGIPEPWLTGLAERTMIKEILQGLVGERKEIHG